MKHAYLADMGGFVLHSPDYKPFPLDAEKLFYLVDHNDVGFPSITVDGIDDKNKADGFSRYVREEEGEDKGKS